MYLFFAIMIYSTRVRRNDEAMEVNSREQKTKNSKTQTELIKLIPEPKTLYILHTFHYNIILVFFKGFQFAGNAGIM